MARKIDKEAIIGACVFSASRSSGPGGQNVNKVNTRVTLEWNIANDESLSEEIKAVLMQKLAKRISQDGMLQLSSQESRSQMKNKELVTKKLFELIEKSLEKKKKRIPTKPGKAAVAERLKGKKVHSEKKKMRRKLDD
jgi:ribosome-associated protein